MSEKLLNDFREYLENKKKFSMNTINSYDRDLRKIFLYLVEMGYSIKICTVEIVLDNVADE